MSARPLKQRTCNATSSRSTPSARSCRIPSTATSMSPSSSTCSWRAARSRSPRRIIYGALDADREEEPARIALEVFDQALEQRQADGRSEVPPRRRRQLPGAGRSASGRAAWRWRCAGCAKRRASAARSRWRSGWPPSCSKPSEGRGGAMKKREEVHRMAEANKAFSHFRF